VTDCPCADCRAPSTNQALYRRADGSHFLGAPVCDAHRYPLGRLRYTIGVEIIDYLEVIR